MQAAIVIGVDRVGGGLSRLAGAASGAREVADWLSRNAYETSIFTDEDSLVDRGEIFGAIRRHVEAHNLERLLVYFAGHGFLKGPLDEVWLLSDAPLDPAAAINVSLSAAMARYKGIPEIIFISDACRVTPKSTEMSSINGTSIFPNSQPSQNSAEIDFYYGTHPGDPAYERGETEAKQAQGLFTEQLLNAHVGAPREAILSINGREYVHNRWLKNELRERVDLKAQKISLSLTQKPDVHIQIENGFIAQNEVASPSESSTPSASALEPFTKGSKPVSQPDLAPADREFKSTLIAGRARASPDFQKRLKISKQHYLETPPFKPAGKAFVVRCRGGNIETLQTSPGLAEITNHYTRSEQLRIFATEGKDGQLALQFDDGSGMVLPVLQDYTCDIIRYEGRTISIGYSWNYFQDPMVSELREEVLSAATLGLLNHDPYAVRKFARRIRRYKRFDPTLGLVAALAYMNAGEPKGAISVRDYMRADLGIDLFDVWLLSGAGESLPIWPHLPMLSQTWSFLDVFGHVLPGFFTSMPRIPGFWTVFEAQAMPTILEYVGISYKDSFIHG
ncbi:caspase family protein [Euryhalocaulis caribicus]|uniref:caspase family protein n=1 Tax=Euryhalocaulis caribicus TaxID=1161401 RepID=UPI0003AAB5F7|nr:caspase family protein [Euryhalocaulis caribicus]